MSDEDVANALVNLRDVAIACPDVLRPGLLLRSDAPLLDDDDSGYAVAWPPRTVVDLRRPAECGVEHPLARQATVVSIPIGGRAAYDIEAPDAGLDTLYAAMLRPPSAPELVRAIDAVSDAETPVLVHCTAGKDRTGVLIALVLRLLHVDDETILDDYEATSAAVPRILGRLPMTLAAMGWRPSDLPEGLRGIDRDALAAAIEALDVEHGGVEEWHRRHGGDPGSLHRLRARFGR